MNTNARYIITTAGIAAGLFTIGATANALSSDNTATTAPLGAGVVLPAAAADPSASPSLVEVEYAEHSDPSTGPTGAVVLPDAGWSTGAGTTAGDDDHGDDSDNRSDDHSDDDSDNSVDD
jgi:hypothetical protein